MRSMEERTVLVTGATDGLGRRVARHFAEKGATVLLHGRDAGRAGAAAREISEETGNDKLRYHLADFSSLGDVRRLAEEVGSRHDRLDVLVNNAGVILPVREESRDGVELTFAVNYLSHFLLTRLLLPLLVRGFASAPAPARIVNVASAAQSPINFDDPMLEKRYDPMLAYSQSKLATAMHAFDLAGELRGSGVTANALHPATLMDTKMVRETFGYARSTVEEGAEATVRLAASPEVEGVTGRYFDGKREARVDRQAYDEEARGKLRRLSEQLAGLR
jgi:NAD(P)-dependent dehydrogenase (short-subunit alcohol dehydrogenase family)